MDTKSAGILGACIIIGALVLSLVPGAMTRMDSEEATSPVRRIHSPDGSLAVDYMVENSPTSAEGGRKEGITDIEFHDNYVVVKDRAGQGSVFFGGRTRSLRGTKFLSFPAENFGFGSQKFSASKLD
jgi:hypothetical protein